MENVTNSFSFNFNEHLCLNLFIYSQLKCCFICYPALQFFLQESHLGQNRATCSLPHLVALNPHVQVSAHTGPLDDELLLRYQVFLFLLFLLDLNYLHLDIKRETTSGSKKKKLHTFIK